VTIFRALSDQWKVTYPHYYSSYFTELSVYRQCAVVLCVMVATYLLTTMITSMSVSAMTNDNMVDYATSSYIKSRYESSTVPKRSTLNTRSSRGPAVTQLATNPGKSLTMESPPSPVEFAVKSLAMIPKATPVTVTVQDLGTRPIESPATDLAARPAAPRQDSGMGFLDKFGPEDYRTYLQGHSDTELLRQLTSKEQKLKSSTTTFAVDAAKLIVTHHVPVLLPLKLRKRSINRQKCKSSRKREAAGRLKEPALVVAG